MQACGLRPQLLLRLRPGGCLARREAAIAYEKLCGTAPWGGSAALAVQFCDEAPMLQGRCGLHEPPAPPRLTKGVGRNIPRDFDSMCDARGIGFRVCEGPEVPGKHVRCASACM